MSTATQPVKITGTLLREPVQGVPTTFAVVVVGQSTIADRHLASTTARQFGPLFGGVPVVLMAQDTVGAPIYVGRPDLVWYMRDVSLTRIPWKQYTLPIPRH